MLRADLLAAGVQDGAEIYAADAAKIYAPAARPLHSTICTLIAIFAMECGLQHGTPAEGVLHGHVVVHLLTHPPQDELVGCRATRPADHLLDFNELGGASRCDLLAAIVHSEFDYDLHLSAVHPLRPWQFGITVDGEEGIFTDLRRHLPSYRNLEARNGYVLPCTTMYYDVLR